jgi:multidrug efflux pump subunit AcrA (membrane-fusion protein)
MRVTFLAIACLLSSLHAFAQQPSSTATTTTSAAPATQPATIVVPGSVAAFYVADLYAKDSGYLSEVKADIGDHVKKGDVLAMIDDPELLQQLKGAEALLAAKEQLAAASEASVQQAKASLEVARSQVAALEAERELAESTLKRQEALFQDKAATSQQIDETRAKARVTAAAADVGRAKITSAEADLRAAEAGRAVAAAQVNVAAADAERTRTLVGYTKVVAPFDGVITRRIANVGDLVQNASTGRPMPLFTCQKLDVVRISCDVPDAAATAVRAGTKADVRLSSSNAAAAPAAIAAAVTRVAVALDPATRTMRAEIDLPNPGEKLRPGMYAQVVLFPQSEPTVARREVAQ